MAECVRQGLDVYRFNTEDFPETIGVHSDPLRPDQTVLLAGKTEIAFGQAKGIWIRRPRWPTISAEVEDPIDRALANQESVAAIGGVLRLLAPKCVSPPDAMQAARWKLPQLRAALEVGFKVPDTIVTTDPDRAKTFAALGPTVVKAVQDARVRLNDVEKVGLARLVDADDNLYDVRLAPTMLQRMVNKTADLRLTVVGDQYFAVRIVVPPSSGVDFRSVEPADCEFRVVDVAPRLARACSAFMGIFGLRFGAFDFAEEVDGTLVFLECNPAGQWGWLEPPTGLRITESLVRLLAGSR